MFTYAHGFWTSPNRDISEFYALSSGSLQSLGHIFGVGCMTVDCGLQNEVTKYCITRGCNLLIFNRIVVQ